MLKFAAIAIVTCGMLVVGFGYDLDSDKGTSPTNLTIDSNSTLAARYPLRARTPDFFGRSKGRTTSAGRYRA